MVLYQVSAYKTEMDSIAQFTDQEYSLEADTKYSASKLHTPDLSVAQLLKNLALL